MKKEYTTVSIEIIKFLHTPFLAASMGDGIINGDKDDWNIGGEWVFP